MGERREKKEKGKKKLDELHGLQGEMHLQRGSISSEEKISRFFKGRIQILGIAFLVERNDNVDDDYD